ncbi:MAG TPA: hypothetical protein VI299_11025 [Polyangiales bacterium]
MKHQLALASLAFVVALALAKPASADVGLGGGALIGTGVDTGDANNNPYRLQLGAYGELSIGNLLIGVRGTRSVKSDPAACSTRDCPDVKDLRTIGGDVGYIWHLPLIHLGPRLGIGQVKEPDGHRAGAYFEPGVSLDLHLLLFNIGAEARYRIVTNTGGDLNAFIAYLRLGLQFGI